MLKFHPYSILTGDTRVEFVIYCVLMTNKEKQITRRANWRSLVLKKEKKIKKIIFSSSYRFFVISKLKSHKLDHGMITILSPFLLKILVKVLSHQHVLASIVRHWQFYCSFVLQNVWNIAQRGRDRLKPPHHHYSVVLLSQV